MKRDLNLMVKRQSDAKTAKSILYLLLFLAILAALYFAATTIPGIIKTNALNQKANLEQQLSALSSTKEKFEAGTQEKKRLLDSVSLVNELEANKKDVPALLDFVEKSCPPNVMLAALRFGPDEMELDGFAETDIELSQFLLGLRENEEFKTVVVKQTVTDPRTLKQFFTINLAFAQPLKAEPIAAAKDGASTAPSPAPADAPAEK